MTLGYTHAEDRGSRGQDSWPVTDRRPSIPTTESPDDSVLRGQAPVWPILLTSWSCPCSWLPRATPRLFGGFRKKSGWQRAHSSGIHIGTENCILSRGHVETWQPCPLSGAACFRLAGSCLPLDWTSGSFQAGLRRKLAQRKICEYQESPCSVLASVDLE